MRISTAFSVLAAVLSLPNVSRAEDCCCVDIIPASRATVRHIEPKGIGYDQGYTTLELFFAPQSPWQDVWTPFIDLRGHLFDNGTNKAMNAGVGLRYFDWARERLWGVNAYYDFHKTKYHSYNQVALGLEWARQGVGCKIKWLSSVWR